MGLLGCLILIAAASGQVPDVAIQIIRAMKYSLQMFIFGAVLPVIVWSIAASEINVRFKIGRECFKETQRSVCYVRPWFCRRFWVGLFQTGSSSVFPSIGSK
jgi:hypothetical protein